MTCKTSMRPHLGFVLPELGAGGAELTTLRLATSLIQQGCRVDLVLLNFRGMYRGAIPKGMRLYYRRRRNYDNDLMQYCCTHGIEVQLQSFNSFAAVTAWRSLRRTWPELHINWPHARAALGVARYIRVAGPQLIFSALQSANEMAILAAELTRSRIPVVVSIRNNVNLNYSEREKSVARVLMPSADAVVGISHGVSNDIVKTLGIDACRVYPIYNPIPVSEIQRQAQEEVSHPWFGDANIPVILSVLRESPAKDWSTLITAFGQVRRVIHARLAILGHVSETYQRQVIALARILDVERDVTFLGFDENPFRYMRRSKLFVHSSRWEGLVNVLVEAMACGTPVVSTDAPYGPAEILEDGRWGRLTPVGDAPALANAMVSSLNGHTVPISALLRRAEDFSTDRATAAYSSLFETLIRQYTDCAIANESA